ncbi:MAG: MBL fold metallo-hydrolase [Oscillospiraceae bacterium]|nr:MBL fold metallo-hydrolase [Oscillospiraceae bacterium]
MARIFPICSSSSANCTFIGTKGHGILIDDGCSFRSLKNSLELIETSVDQIEALFITHEHIDHVKGLSVLAKNTKIPIFASEGTIKALQSDPHCTLPDNVMLFDIFKEGYQSAEFEVRAFHTPHDTPESVGYVINYNDIRIGVCTDVGTVTEEMEKNLIGCDAVLLESNYDTDMLRRNVNYSPALKRRIASDMGHLSNSAAAEFAEKLVKSGTTRLILGHLSRENNTPNTAFSCTCSHLQKKGMKAGSDFTLDIAPIVTEGQYIAL